MHGRENMLCCMGKFCEALEPVYIDLSSFIPALRYIANSRVQCAGYPPSPVLKNRKSSDEGLPPPRKQNSVIEGSDRPFVKQQKHQTTPFYNQD